MATLTPNKSALSSPKTTLTLEQQRALNAWECSKECNKDYVNAAKSLPALIMNSGLMQVLAFCQEKEGANKIVADQLREWLRKRFRLEQGVDFKEFMQHMMEANPAEYQAITAEAFAWLRWLRQMAPARVKGA